ncbi:hypothetical protein LXM94_08500 [Rhizobium sp. TRM95111]|uniref:hypothetical protein n=1 Tax=Rhizobium alarense TaxID=2846851 RepID=UPI001F2F5D25|nr:hypothetical protein [Rhizobium alarense]MCF3640008.1 hypothetical protein [Rhizobium alarense]
MAPYSKSPATKVLLAALMLAVVPWAAMPAVAGDRGDDNRAERDRDGRKPYYLRHRRHDHDDHRARLRTPKLQNFEGNDGFISSRLRYEGDRDRSVRRNGDFYGGSLSAYETGDGDLYIYDDRDGRYDDRRRTREVSRGGTRIIGITPNGSRACSWEGGVCVIRP